MRINIFAIIIFLLFTNYAFGDGPPHDFNNRYTGGEVVILELTDTQIAYLGEPERKFADLLKLTPKQTELINQKWGVAPTEIEVWETRKGLWDCTCMSANLGLRFSHDKIEVPKAHVMSDEDAEQIRNPE
jgi:hypothetical protein